MKLKLLISILGIFAKSGVNDNSNIPHINSPDHDNTAWDKLAAELKGLNSKPQIIRLKMSEVLDYYEPKTNSKTNKESAKAEDLNSELVENNPFLAMLREEIPSIKSELPYIYHIFSYILSYQEDHSNKDYHPDVAGEVD